MPTYHTPGVYIEEVSTGTRPIEGVGTRTAAFLGEAPAADARVNEAVVVENWSQFCKEFVRPDSVSTPLSLAVWGFFQNGGSRVYIVNVGKGAPITGGGGRGRRGIDLLEPIDEIAMVAAPGLTDAVTYDTVLTHCETLQDRVAILDAPLDVKTIESLTRVATTTGPKKPAKKEGEPEPPASTETPGLRPRLSERGYGALYFPWLWVRDPLIDPRTLKPGETADVATPPSGHMAGIYARTDAQRGVHKAPANEVVRAAAGLTYPVTREEQGLLNQSGVNCIRMFPRAGILVWGARTLAEAASEWRYINVRRLFNMIEESIALGTRWVVFEPNDVTLWKSIERDVEAFLLRIWADGALMGKTPREAFFVQCNEETNPRENIDAGIVTIRIGIAPVKPAEFVVFKIGQYVGGTTVEAEGGGNA